jgi:hypothetical protein
MKLTYRLPEQTILQHSCLEKASMAPLDKHGTFHQCRLHSLRNTLRGSHLPAREEPTPLDSTMRLLKICSILATHPNPTASVRILPQRFLSSLPAR